MHVPLYFNGRYTTTAERVLGVEDRGFQFGDGIYEVVKFQNKRPLFASEHLERMSRGLTALEIPVPLERNAWLEVFGELIERSGESDGTLYLQVTRGETARTTLYPADHPTTVVAYARGMAFPSREAKVAGISAVTVPDLRWSRCDIKSVNLLGSVLARQEARRNGAAEALLLRENVYTEGAHSNVFFLLDGVIVTHPANERILRGTVRTQVLRIARETGLKVAERPLLREELDLVSEAFITSTSQGVMPLRTLDGLSLGSNATSLKLGDLYAELEQRLATE